MMVQPVLTGLSPSIALIKYTLAALLVLATCFIGSAAAGQSFYGTGQAALMGGDQSQALAVAYQSGRKKAISAALEQYVYLNDVDKYRYNLKLADIFQTTLPFVISEKIANREEKAGLLIVKVEVTIDKSQLARFMASNGLAAKSVKQDIADEKPAVMVLIVEQMNGAINPFAYSAQLTQQTLLSHNYRVVDEAAVKRAIKHEQAVQSVLNNDLSAVQSAALQLRAGLILSGQAIAQASSLSSGGMQAYGATVSLQLTEASTGKLLASANGDGSYPHINPVQGAKAALELAAEKSVQQLLKHLSESSQGVPARLTLTLAGANFQQLTVLKQVIKRDFPTVLKIHDLGFSGNLGRLELELNGSATQLAGQIAVKHYEGFTLEVINQSPGRLDLRLSL